MTTNELTTSDRVSLRFLGLTFCPRCELVVELIGFAEAAEAYNTDLQDITRLAQDGDVHKLHGRRGDLMLCGLSLIRTFENRRTRLLVSTVGNAF